MDTEESVSKRQAIKNDILLNMFQGVSDDEMNCLHIICRTGNVELCREIIHHAN